MLKKTMRCRCTTAQFIRTINEEVELDLGIIGLVVLVNNHG